MGKMMNDMNDGNGPGMDRHFLPNLSLGGAGDRGQTLKLLAAVFRPLRWQYMLFTSFFLWFESSNLETAGKGLKPSTLLESVCQNMIGMHWHAILCAMQVDSAHSCFSHSPVRKL